jgi:hypothetical protein
VKLLPVIPPKELPPRPPRLPGDDAVVVPVIGGTFW